MQVDAAGIGTQACHVGVGVLVDDGGRFVNDCHTHRLGILKDDVAAPEVRGELADRTKHATLIVMDGAVINGVGGVLTTGVNNAVVHVDGSAEAIEQAASHGSSAIGTKQHGLAIGGGQVDNGVIAMGSQQSANAHTIECVAGGQVIAAGEVRTRRTKVHSAHNFVGNCIAAGSGNRSIDQVDRAVLDKQGGDLRAQQLVGVFKGGVLRNSDSRLLGHQAFHGLRRIDGVPILINRNGLGGIRNRSGAARDLLQDGQHVQLLSGAAAEGDAQGRLNCRYLLRVGGILAGSGVDRSLDALALFGQGRITAIERIVQGNHQSGFINCVGAAQLGYALDVGQLAVNPLSVQAVPNASQHGGGNRIRELVIGTHGTTVIGGIHEVGASSIVIHNNLEVTIEVNGQLEGVEGVAKLVQSSAAVGDAGSQPPLGNGFFCISSIVQISEIINAHQALVAADVNIGGAVLGSIVGQLQSLSVRQLLGIAGRDLVVDHIEHGVVAFASAQVINNVVLSVNAGDGQLAVSHGSGDASSLGGQSLVQVNGQLAGEGSHDGVLAVLKLAIAGHGNGGLAIVFHHILVQRQHTGDVVNLDILAGFFLRSGRIHIDGTIGGISDHNQLTCASVDDVILGQVCGVNGQLSALCHVDRQLIGGGNIQLNIAIEADRHFAVIQSLVLLDVGGDSLGGDVIHALVVCHSGQHVAVQVHRGVNNGDDGPLTLVGSRQGGGAVVQDGIDDGQGTGIRHQRGGVLEVGSGNVQNGVLKILRSIAVTANTVAKDGVLDDQGGRLIGDIAAIGDGVLKYLIAAPEVRGEHAAGADGRGVNIMDGTIIQVVGQMLAGRISNRVLHQQRAAVRHIRSTSHGASLLGGAGGLTVDCQGAIGAGQVDVAAPDSQSGADTHAIECVTGSGIKDKAIMGGIRGCFSAVQSPVGIGQGEDLVDSLVRIAGQGDGAVGDVCSTASQNHQSGAFLGDQIVLRSQVLGLAVLDNNGRRTILGGKELRHIRPSGTGLFSQSGIGSGLGGNVISASVENADSLSLGQSLVRDGSFCLAHQDGGNSGDLRGVAVIIGREVSQMAHNGGSHCTGGRRLRQQLAVGTGDQAIAHRPLHSSGSPIADLGLVGERGQVVGAGQLNLLHFAELHQHQGHFLTGDGSVRHEGGGGTASRNPIDEAPFHSILIPILGQVGKAVGGGLHSGLASHGIQHLGQLSTAQILFRIEVALLITGKQASGRALADVGSSPPPAGGGVGILEGAGSGHSGGLFQSLGSRLARLVQGGPGGLEGVVSAHVSKLGVNNSAGAQGGYIFADIGGQPEAGIALGLGIGQLGIDAIPNTSLQGGGDGVGIGIV